MKMKKLVVLLASGALVLSLASCGKKAEEPAPAPAPTEAPAPAAPAMGGSTTAAPAAAPAPAPAPAPQVNNSDEEKAAQLTSHNRADYVLRNCQLIVRTWIHRPLSEKIAGFLFDKV